ncbi:MAG: ParA family protein [Solirubrobacterales bacterium]
MKVISIFNQKGGVGKTTTSINLCSYLALQGYKVLNIDIDPQGNTTSGLGFDKRKIENSIYDVLTSNLQIDNAVKQCDLVENFFILPSTVELAGAEVEMINIPKREFILKDKISEMKSKYDFVFIDCPPSLGFLTINALTASDSVLIPIQCEFYALEGVGQLVNTIQLVKKSLNKTLEIEGVIMSMYDSRARLSQEVIIEAKKYFKDKVYDTTIPRNIRLAEAPSFGLPIMLYDDKCKGSEAYEQLTKEFLRRQGGK